MDQGTLRYWLNNKKVLLCHDTDSSSYGRGLLKTLPAIAYLFNSEFSEPRFTYPKQWRQLGNSDQFEMYPQKWVLSDELSNIQWPLGVVTNNHYEQNTPYSIRPAVGNVRRAGYPVFIVSDTEKFRYQGEERPVADYGYSQQIGSYDSVLAAIKTEYSECGYQFPLNDSKNLFLQDNAILYNTIYAETKKVRTVRELFAHIHSAPYLPLYTSLTNIFNRGESFGATALPQGELDNFRKWLQYRLDRSQSECRDIAELLNGQVLDQQTNFTKASQIDHPSLNQVRSFIDDITPETNAVDEKFNRWLQSAIANEF